MSPRRLIIKFLVIAMLTPVAFYSPDSAAFSFDDLKSKVKKYEKEIKEKKQQLDLATGKVNQKDEINIGRNVMSGLLGAAPLLDNDQLQQYVNRVGHWIALQSERPDLPWTFGVIDSPNINAFAAPGGYIVLTAGLYQLLENESQLAAVLAHEISHVIEKHHLNAIRDTSQRELLADLAVKVTDEKYREKMSKLVNSGVQIYARGLDQRFEYGADRRGVVLAARSGYNPYAMLDVLTTLSSINAADASMAVFLNTHPSPADRIDTLVDMMDKRLKNLPVPQDNNRLRQVNQQISGQL